MKVRELIAALQKCPPGMEVEIPAPEGDADYEPVVEALYEDGATAIALLTTPSGAQPVKCEWQECGSDSVIVRQTQSGELYVCAAHAQAPLDGETCALCNKTRGDHPHRWISGYCGDFVPREPAKSESA